MNDKKMEKIIASLLAGETPKESLMPEEEKEIKELRLLLKQLDWHALPQPSRERLHQALAGRPATAPEETLGVIARLWIHHWKAVVSLGTFAFVLALALINFTIITSPTRKTETLSVESITLQSEKSVSPAEEDGVFSDATIAAGISASSVTEPPPPTDDAELLVLFNKLDDSSFDDQLALIDAEQQTLFGDFNAELDNVYDENSL